jgi:hypothetical protein
MMTANHDTLTGEISDLMNQWRANRDRSQAFLILVILISSFIISELLPAQPTDQPHTTNAVTKDADMAQVQPDF